MDAVGARLSRSSTRYGPVGSSNASFSGTVRKWRKAWAPLAGGASGGGGGGAGSASAGMGPIGCPRGNKMVLLKWAPVSGAGAGAGDGNGNGKEVAAAATRRRYVPALPQNPTRKSGSTELNLNLGLEDPDDDSDADLSADEQPDSSSTPRSENRLKRKVF